MHQELVVVRFWTERDIYSQYCIRTRAGQIEASALRERERESEGKISVAPFEHENAGLLRRSMLFRTQSDPFDRTRSGLTMSHYRITLKVPIRLDYNIDGMDETTPDKLNELLKDTTAVSQRFTAKLDEMYLDKTSGQKLFFYGFADAPRQSDLQFPYHFDPIMYDGGDDPANLVALVTGRVSFPCKIKLHFQDTSTEACRVNDPDEYINFITTRFTDTFHIANGVEKHESGDSGEASDDYNESSSDEKCFDCNALFWAKEGGVVLTRVNAGKVSKRWTHRETAAKATSKAPQPYPMLDTADRYKSKNETALEPVETVNTADNPTTCINQQIAKTMESIEVQIKLMQETQQAMLEQLARMGKESQVSNPFISATSHRHEPR